VNEDNLTDVRREAIGHCRNRKREYLKDKINGLEPNSKNKNIRDLYRGINEFKKGYQPKTNLVKDDRGDLLADPHKISNSRKNYFCQLLAYTGRAVLGRPKCIQPSHLCHSPVPRLIINNNTHNLCALEELFRPTFDQTIAVYM
jgi:hypothetical protein